MELFVLSAINGLIYGMLLFMLSSGLTLIFGIMGVLNFAHASLYMLGAYFAFQIAQFTNFWVGLFVAPVLVGLVGAAIERYLLRRLHKYGHIPELLLTFGLFFLIEEVVKLVWGQPAVPYRVPALLHFTLFRLYNSSFAAYKLFMFVVAVLVFVALFLMLKRTRVGLIVQASIGHPEMVTALGHNVPLVFMGVFGVGAALAGLAGTIMGNFYVTEPSMAYHVGLIIFVIIVVGGLGSVTGAFIASIIIGLMDTLAVAFEYSLSDLLNVFHTQVSMSSPLYDFVHIKISDTAGVLPFLLMLVLLIFRPTGLMGQREV
ncbi:MAG TPA: branched-chain amino acid ABC transporter permease [bacterium]|nr:branched-chain amino acid ABC transporter permease [bacterium]